MTPEEARATMAGMSEHDFPDAVTTDLSEHQYELFVEEGRKAAGRPSLSADGSHSPHITVQLPATMERALREKAAAEHLSVSQWARQVIERELVAT